MAEGGTVRTAQIARRPEASALRTAVVVVVVVVVMMVAMVMVVVAMALTTMRRAVKLGLWTVYECATRTPICREA
eukprot:2193466-Pleurochrysis_carterae.AAC.1